MTDISFDNVFMKVKEASSFLKEVSEKPETVVERAKEILTNEILSDESEFLRFYGVSFQSATQEQRDEYVSLLKIVNSVWNDIGKAVID